MRYDEKQNKDMEFTSTWGFCCAAETTNETHVVIKSDKLSYSATNFCCLGLDKYIQIAMVDP